MGCIWSKEEPAAISESTTTATAATTITTTSLPQGSRLESNDDIDIEECLYYDSLPYKAEECHVKSVYDGDTLTLTNGEKVRFLGIDTPELKRPKQAYSQEARDYVVRHCLESSNKIWMVQNNTDKKANNNNNRDQYGRLLRWIYVLVHNNNSNNDKHYYYLNLCEGLVYHGLATAYFPANNNTYEMTTKKKILNLQKRARLEKRGQWKDFQDYDVVMTQNGVAFHCSSCIYLKRTMKHNLIQIKASDALDLGKHCCRKCLAKEK